MTFALGDEVRVGVTHLLTSYKYLGDTGRTIGAPTPTSPSRPEPHEDIVRLTVTHENLANNDDYQAISGGWPAVLANLKSLLETGEVLPQAPWDMSSASS